jgi:hypothetical protein
MAHEGSPLVALSQQGDEVANAIAAQRSAVNPRGEPFVGNRSNDQGKRARSDDIQAEEWGSNLSEVHSHHPRALDWEERRSLH